VARPGVRIYGASGSSGFGLRSVALRISRAGLLGERTTDEVTSLLSHVAIFGMCPFFKSGVFGLTQSDTNADWPVLQWHRPLLRPPATVFS
jgi:hypothetical protein